MACRFPGASNVDAYWDNLRNGVESISFITDEQLRESGGSPEELTNKNYVKARPVKECIYKAFEQKMGNKKGSTSR